MGIDNLSPSMLRAMHRRKTLYQPTAHENRSPLPNPEPERDVRRALDEGQTAPIGGLARVVVRFTGYRVKPLDADNFAGSVKHLLDGLRHTHLIDGDEPWRIKLETEQVKVARYKDEKTVIEIADPDEAPETEEKRATGQPGAEFGLSGESCEMFVATWLGQLLTYQRNQGGGYDHLRTATAQDIASLPRLPR